MSFAGCAKEVGQIMEIKREAIIRVTGKTSTICYGLIYIFIFRYDPLKHDTPDLDLRFGKYVHHFQRFTYPPFFLFVVIF